MRLTRRFGRRAAAIVAVSAGLGGCFWPAPGAGPGRTASNVFESEITAATVAGLELEWTATGDGGPMREAVTSDRAVHAYDANGAYAFDPGTGGRLWSVPNPVVGIGTIGPVVADGEQVVLGYGFGNLGGHWTTAILDAGTGASLGTGHPGLVDGLAGSVLLTHSYAFGSGTPTASFLDVSDAASPAASWSGLISFGNAGVNATATLGTTRVYLASANVMTSPTVPGNAVHAYPVVGPPPTCPLPQPPPPVSDPTRFTCPLWSTPVDGTHATPPVVTGAPTETAVYTGTDAGTVYALDAATGAVQWSVPVGSAVTGSPALAGGSLYVPTRTGGLVVLDAATGATLWTAPTTTPVTVQPAVAGGLVYVGQESGKLWAFDAAGCGAATCRDPLWKVRTGAAITGAPAVSQGRLYAGTADDRLLAFGLPAG
ncbi:MAG TPA: PQQ-binding-like beta-propeller repeat protein [Acidimicrobiales bacterium]|jgi:outer membrane protein assembly factor BamB